MSERRVTSDSTACGVSFPSCDSAKRILAPPEKNSGPPHSSVSRWATSEQMTLWYDWQQADVAKELAAVPLKTKKISQSHSNISRRRPATSSVYLSSP